MRNIRNEMKLDEVKGILEIWLVENSSNSIYLPLTSSLFNNTHHNLSATSVISELT